MLVIHGTETGNAEIVAEDLATHLRDKGHDASAVGMADLEVDRLTSTDFVIVVCSTYNEGELPNTAIAFVEGLQESGLNLESLRFAAFGLGDSYYEDTYAHGIRIVSETLEALGATAVGTTGIHDASNWTVPSDDALAWADSELKQVWLPHLLAPSEN